MDRLIARGNTDEELIIIAEQSKVVELGFDEKGEDTFKVLHLLNVMHPDVPDSPGDLFFFQRGKYNHESGFFLLPLKTKLFLHCPDLLLTFYKGYGNGLSNDTKLQDFVMALHQSDYVKSLFNGRE